MFSDPSGGGGGGVGLSNRGGGNSGSGKSSRRLNNDKSLNRKSHQEKTYGYNLSPKNSLYMTKEAAEKMATYFHALIELGDKGILDLYEVISVTDLIPNSEMNDLYIYQLDQLIHNNKEPVALSGSQEYNRSSNKGKKNWNVHTKTNSSYAMRTVFYDTSQEHEYLSIDNSVLIFNIGQIIAHEFFGHLAQSLVTGSTNEPTAMGVENNYNFIFGYPQRQSYDFERGRRPLGPFAPIFKK